jgi:prolyl oligopeptidase
LIYVKTNVNAPRHKVITIDISKGEPETRDFIPEQKDATLVHVKCVNNEYFVVIYKRNVIVVSFVIYFSILLTSICHP